MEMTFHLHVTLRCHSSFFLTCRSNQIASFLTELFFFLPVFLSSIPLVNFYCELVQFSIKLRYLLTSRNNSEIQDGGCFDARWRHNEQKTFYLR